MGWGSAGQIFNTVTHALIRAGVDDEALAGVCFALAKALTDQDWDTVDESVQEFRGHPIVVHALRRADKWMYLIPDGQALVEFEPATGEWVLLVDEEEVGRRAATPAGWNELVDLWFAAGPDDEERREYRSHAKIA